MTEKQIAPLARRRVKLYALNAERQWDDRGTGHVTSAYVERLKGMSLLVRAENDGKTLLESKIMTDTAYQKQQETLIVWSEGENFDLALSFQEKDGCGEIWEKICQVQGKDPAMDTTQEIIEESEEERFDDGNDSSLTMMDLPACELGKLEQISEVIASCVHNPNRQEKIAITIETENYIKKLLELFRESEDLENTKSLHILYDIFKNIFLLNRNSLLDILFAEENIFDVVGALEYDPNATTPKKHREFLRKTSVFKEVIPLENTDLVSKIHQTFRIQYIQDIALPNQVAFEDNIPATLSSYIYFNKVEIVSVIQDDDRLLTRLFNQLSAETATIPEQRDLILFLKEFCTFSQTLQPPNRELFYKTLSTLGVLSAIEVTLKVPDAVVKAASIDILGFFVEFSPSMVRDHMLQQLQRLEEEAGNQSVGPRHTQDRLLLNIMLMQMVTDSDIEMGGAVQLMGILRIILDPENMTSNNNKAERAEYLSFFYKNSIQYLVAPLLYNTKTGDVGYEDYQTAQLIALILELLTFCVEHHTYHMKNYILNHDLLVRVLILLKSRHSFLGLSAVRFIRKIIGMKDDFYNRHLISLDSFAPLVERLIKNDGRYNLIDSAICEIFEVIRTEKLKNLMVYAVDNFDSKVSHIDYVQTFSILREKVCEKMLPREKTVPLDMLRSTNPLISRSARGDMQEMEDEMWINSAPNQMDFAHLKQQDFLKSASTVGLEDDDEDDTATLLSSGATSPLLSSKMKARILSEEPDEEEVTNNNDDVKSCVTGALFGAGSFGVTNTSVAPRVTSLVDYDVNSDEDEEAYTMFEAGGGQKNGGRRLHSSPTKAATDAVLKAVGGIHEEVKALYANAEEVAVSISSLNGSVESPPKKVGKTDDVQEEEAAVKSESPVKADAVAEKEASFTPSVDCAPKVELDEEKENHATAEDFPKQDKKRDRSSLEEDDIHEAIDETKTESTDVAPGKECQKQDSVSAVNVESTVKDSANVSPAVKDSREATETTAVNGVDLATEDVSDPSRKKQKLSLE